MVGPNGFEPSTSSVSRKRSRPTELRAYTPTTVSHSNGQQAITTTFASRLKFAESRAGLPDPHRLERQSAAKPPKLGLI
jgi:hypothetical protein